MNTPTIRRLTPSRRHQLLRITPAAWLSVIAALALVVTPTLYLRSRIWPNVGQIIGILVAAVFGALSFGQWLGYSMLYSQFNQDVHLKGTTLSNVKLVAVLARHTILLDGKMLRVVPTADITEFRSITKE